MGPVAVQGSRLEPRAPHAVRDTHTKAVAAAKAAEAKRVTGTKPSLPLARYAGMYADSLYGDVTITTAGNGLRLKFGTHEGSLEHWQYDTFRIKWDNRWQGSAG